MLSILIPVYNYDVRVLANDLSKQVSGLNIPVEILFLDDCSSEEIKNINAETHVIPFVRYEYNDVNLGFTQARNKLVSLSLYDMLLFLDSDVKILNPNFLVEYTKRLQHDTVYCGGIVYSENPPADPSLMLKWKNGKYREEGRVEEKNQNPWVAFTAANFLIPKYVIQEIPLDVNSVLYGFNDTMYGYRLMRNGVFVQHFNNPVLHEGLMSAEKYIGRIIEGRQNLRFFAKQSYVEPKSFKEFIKVLGAEEKIKKYKLGYLLKILDFCFYKLILNHLKKSKNPNLVLFDFFKLFALLKTQE